jgi:hypothetical protein
MNNTTPPPESTLAGGNKRNSRQGNKRSYVAYVLSRLKSRTVIPVVTADMWGSCLTVPLLQIEHVTDLVPVRTIC